MWEFKMCRLAWQLLDLLGNVLERPRHALQRPRRPRHAFLQGPKSPTSKKTPPLVAFLQGPRTLRTLLSMPF